MVGHVLYVREQSVVMSSWTQYNRVDILLNTHNRQPITRLWFLLRFWLLKILQQSAEHQLIWIIIWVDKLHQNRPISQIPQCIRQLSHYALFCNRNNGNVHISVTEWCIMGYGTGALWDLCNRSIECFSLLIFFVLGHCKDDVSKYRMKYLDIPWCCNIASAIMIILALVIGAKVWHKSVNQLWKCWDIFLSTKYRGDH